MMKKKKKNREKVGVLSDSVAVHFTWRRLKNMRGRPAVASSSGVMHMWAMQSARNGTKCHEDFFFCSQW